MRTLLHFQMGDYLGRSRDLSRSACTTSDESVTLHNTPAQRPLIAEASSGLRCPLLACVSMLIVAPLLIVHSSAYAKSPTVLTSCGNITQPGNYVLANDLVLLVENPNEGAGGDCLVVSSPRVNINMNGFAVTATCPDTTQCVGVYGPVGGTGIDIMPGAPDVSISNGGSQNFEIGILVQANDTSLSNFQAANDDVGIALDNISDSTFTNISFTVGLLPYNFFLADMVLVNGGGHNRFSNLIAESFESIQGIVITNSSYNTIEGSTVSCGAEEQAGPGILLTAKSNNNSVTSSSVSVLFGDGIEIDSGSNFNLVKGDDVSILSPLDYFAMLDENLHCGQNRWIDNSFDNLTSKSSLSASPFGCID